MKIIFAGTPAFALPALQALIDSDEHQVVAAFTQAPKNQGRGLSLIASPVQQLASRYGIPVYTPKTLKDSETTKLIASIEADIIIVVAYGLIVPKEILSAKKYGCLNIHPSLLPKYRGAAPLQRTIINGDQETAVAIMQMDEGLDTGDIILQEKFPISPKVTLSYLHDKCAKIGAELLIQTLDNIDKLPKVPQSEQGISYAHKLNKEEGKIIWQDSAYKIDCMVRGMSPWPGVYFSYKEKYIKVIEAEYSNEQSNFTPGTIIDHEMNVACGTGILKIKKLQQSGKTILPAEEFVRGARLTIGEVLK